MAATWEGKSFSHASFSVIGFPVIGLVSKPARSEASAFSHRAMKFSTSGVESMGADGMVVIPYDRVLVGKYEMALLKRLEYFFQ